jgi:hypothetical protein
MERDAFEDGKKITLELLVAATRLVIGRARGEADRCERGGFIHGAKQDELLVGRGSDEIFPEELAAFFVHAGETIEEGLALCIGGPFGEDDVDEFVDERALGAGRVGGGII